MNPHPYKMARNVAIVGDDDSAAALHGECSVGGGKTLLIRSAARVCMLLLIAVLAPFEMESALAQASIKGQPNETTRKSALRDSAAANTRPEVAALIHDLDDPSYEVRTRATRALCVIGASARLDLEDAATGGDSEAAIRARNILAMLDELLFVGVDVVMGFTPASASWNQPVDVIVLLTNRSAYPAKVPFELSRGEPSESEELQVTRMIDLADWLTVTGPGGSNVELRVDDINADLKVYAAVRARLDESPTSLLAPGAHVELRISQFNRGWARYPLLEAGRYEVRFAYSPSWDDKELAALQAGRVIAPPAYLQIESEAPSQIARNGVEAEMILTRTDGRLAALLLNRSDQPLVVNRNFGPSPPFAAVHWVIVNDDRMYEIPAASTLHRAISDFSADALSTLAPGDSLEIGRIDLLDLHKAMAAVGADATGDRWRVRFSYVNPCDRSWQARQGKQLSEGSAPEALKQTLPRRLISIRQTTNEIVAPR